MLFRSGIVTAKHYMSTVSIEDVQRVVKENFVGKILQGPPMVSALKVDGVRALQLLAASRVQVEPLVHARYALADGVAAFAHAAQPGTLKVLLDMGAEGKV